MTSTGNRELIRRIARLAKQTSELEQQIKKLEKNIEELSSENESLKRAAGKDLQAGNAEKEGTEDRERSLKFSMTTVLFAEIYPVPRAVEGIDPVVVMDELDEIFLGFDTIASKYRIEKIKTLGDTFMCAGGIPVKNITNPVDVVMAALEMQNFLGEYKPAKRAGTNQIWKLKTGIHTGPVTAVITGKKKVTYEIKGDTVHTASRIKSVSEPGGVYISVMTCELVKEFFSCDYSGNLPVKYKGNLEIFNVAGIRPELSSDSTGRTPGISFATRLGLIQFTDIQEIVLDRLEKELPAHLFYHNVKHTVDVVTEVELIGWTEGCSDEEVLLLKTAALFHDAGHTVSYDNHEFHGAELAKRMLKEFNYTSDQIETICSLIMATKLPPRPSNLLEEIICDADLDYLGRSDFIPVSNTLFEELKAQNKMTDLNEWNKLQVKFISGHQYFTKTARGLREVNKQIQIERIRSLITG